MIWESDPWKVDLDTRAKWLMDKKKQRRWPATSCVRVEQCVMIGCYCVRKLIEARKLTDAVAKRQMRLVRHKARGKPVDSMNWHKLDTLYDLERGLAITKPLLFVCNQIVHSFVFVNGFNDDGGLDSVLFCSERERNVNLFQLSIDHLANAFVAVAKDDVVESCRTWSPAKGDFDSMQK